MFTLKRAISHSLLLFVLTGTALAQESRAPVETPREPVPAVPQEPVVSTAPVVTATATAKRVRFVSPGAVVQLRLEVFNETGQKLFDTEQRGGNVLDWPLQDGAGERLQAGSYACVLTIKSLSGRISQRVGVVTVNDENAAIESAGMDKFSMAQQQSIGPVASLVEGSAGFTVLQQTESEAITTVTHDGTKGQVSRTRGPLSFRVGDIFSGKDKEQMRITEDGSVGIGTSDPQAKLDVAGTIRAERVLIAKPAKPGSADKTTAGDHAQAPDGEQPLASGSGTQNRVAKWTETGGAGTLGDTQITETNGNVVVGNPSLTGNIQIYGTALQDVFAGMGTDINVGPAFNYGYAGGTFGRSAGFFNVRPDASATPPNPSLRFMTANVERMIVTNTGDVGIGTSNPAAKLDVVGATNVSSNLTVDTNTLFVDATNNRVGVGTTTPGHSLDVNTSVGGGIRISNSGNLYFRAGSNDVRAIGMDGFNSLQIGGVSSTQSIVLHTGSPPAGRVVVDFIGNVGIGAPFPTAKLDVDGNINTSTQFNIGGLRVLSVSGPFVNDEPAVNTFAGVNAGLVTAPDPDLNSFAGKFNSFFGSAAGRANTTGAFNSFFGSFAGESNVTANANSFFGHAAGPGTTGGQNSFFGQAAGFFNQSGTANSFFGSNAGFNGTTGNNNSFFGTEAGRTTNGSDNSFFGRRAGLSNTGGSSNTLVGSLANVGSGNLTNATAIGAGALVSSSNTVVLGRSADGVSVPGSLNVTGNLTVNGTLNATLPTDSDNYIQNTTAQQAGANFNISGDGTAGGTLSGFAVNAATQYKIGDRSVFRVFPTPENTFAGVDAGPTNMGTFNTFFGHRAGFTNHGTHNTFFGRIAGGGLSGNLTGTNNTYFGSASGAHTTSGSWNTFFGRAAGSNNEAGSRNTYVGFLTNGQTALGADPNNSTAIGQLAWVECDNCLVLGAIDGVNGATASVNVGIGTALPTERLHVAGNGLVTGNLTVSGNLQMPGTASQFFGTTTRQMLNLWNSVYGVGVQNNTLYTRSDGGFAWFKQGIHNDNPNNAGTGGTVLMTLDASGNLNVTGNLSKGGGSFKIDHPLDPANKTLSHSFVESPDMMNVYNGNTTTDARGLAVVTLPDYFEALNRDFRYQLTVIGQFAQAMVLEEIKGNRFTIKTNRPRAKVSWQVTGVRRDAYANKNRIPTEELKLEAERGTYLHPDAFVPQPASTGTTVTGLGHQATKRARSRK